MTKLNLIVEGKFNGTDWADFSSDVMSISNVSSGMSGSNDADRVANPGIFSFRLKNDINNSAGLLGYYSPGHTNCRSGFTVALPIRIRFLFDGVYWVNWIGEIVPNGIDVTPGTYAERDVLVTGNDWFYHASTHEITTLAYATSKRADEGIVLVNANMIAQPDATLLDTGTYTFASIFGMLRSKTTAISEFQKFAMSERGYIYLRNGTLVFENRTHRDSLAAITQVSLPSSLCSSLLAEDDTILLAEDGTYLLAEDTQSVTFNNNMCEMKPEGFGDSLFNKVVYTVYPQEDFTDTLAVTQTRIALEAGETKTGIILSYRDPTGGAPSVTLKSIADPFPVSNTDYKMSANLDGTGTDLVAALTPTFHTYANNTLVDIQNTGATKGYVYLQVRGVGLRNYDKVSKITEDTTSQITYKQVRTLTIDAPYQNDPVVADTYASIMLNAQKDPHPAIETVSFYTNTDEKRAVFLSTYIGARVTLEEEVSGIREDYFIQGISWSLLSYSADEGALIKFTWIVKPARLDVYQFAKWDTAGRGWESGYGWAP